MEKKGHAKNKLDLRAMISELEFEMETQKSELEKLKGELDVWNDDDFSSEQVSYVGSKANNIAKQASRIGTISREIRNSVNGGV